MYCDIVIYIVKNYIYIHNTYIYNMKNTILAIHKII